MLIDTHTHIADPEFDADRAAVIERALAAGVRKMVLIGTDLASSQEAVTLAAQYPFFWATVGLHPHEAKSLDQNLLQAIEKLAEHPKVVGLGKPASTFTTIIPARRNSAARLSNRSGWRSESGSPW